ncbi:DUF6493 family protein [Streptomyces sp. LP05-1]|uniref:DUF6493 family protein n=1 Tax=Streptomyces pyxinae TaxID=2970734 RepID=A0ABT2CH09_9ACTN|nr:DUF6493 family protein [Streptomyces sp. LP05-1]MCS0636695.1 DUF6493 family protein [Streptomyces sp. LP05-1]
MSRTADTNTATGAEAALIAGPARALAIGHPADATVATGPAGAPDTPGDGTVSGVSHGVAGYVAAAIRAGRHQAVPALAARLTPAQRCDLARELPGLRKEFRALGWNRWEERENMRVALVLAGAVCHTGAAASASWLGARELRDWEGLPTERLLALYADRDPAWLGDLAHRLANRASTAEEDYPLIRGLVRLAGCPVPTTDAFVRGWATAMVALGYGDRDRVRLDDALRAEPAVRELVARLFETVEPADALVRFGDPERPQHWPAALARLAGDGTLERPALVRSTLARLLRGGRPQQLRVFTAVLRKLELTPQEERRHLADWIALAADAPSPVAAEAQQVATRLWEAGELTAERLAELSDAVLFRPEKKLVRAQLVLLGKALRRDPGARQVLLPAVAGAFGHGDTALQERALALVTRHLRPGDDALREELAGQAALLSPAHQPAAAALFGADLSPTAGEPYEETLPPAPVPRRLCPAPETVAETVELVAALVRARRPDPAGFEVALDGLVRHAHRDRAALAEALEPVLATGWRWERDEHGRVDPGRLGWLELVAAAVLRRVRPADLTGDIAEGSRRDCPHEALERVLRARLYEVAHRVRTAPPPFLLATPSWETGAIEPEELAGRLAAYHRLGLEPAPADFAQALLRVRRDPAAASLAAAAGSPAGDRLARWLVAPGDAADRLERRVEEPAPHRPGHLWGRARAGVRRVVVATRERLLPLREFPPAFHTLGRAHTGLTERCWHWDSLDGLRGAVLPEDRELQAAWALPGFTACAVSGERGACAELPRLAELGGEAGPVLHLAVATGLGARHPEDRLAAVDALLVLAARGELDAARVGRDLAELIGMGTVKPNRLADAARTAAATGACATTWAVLAPALPALLPVEGGAGQGGAGQGGAGQGGAGQGEKPGSVPSGAGELLAVAADCVERCGATGPVPAGLDAAAGRTGSSRFAAQARRLRDGLSAAGRG